MNDRDTDQPENEYLWDRSGPPDSEVVRLEQVLGVLRQRRPLRPLPVPFAAPRWQLAVHPGLWLAAAALVMLIAGAGWFTFALARSTWGVSSLTGAPAVDGRAVTGRARLGRGEWLETDGASRARIAVGSIGTVDVDPNTRVQLVEADVREHRMALDRGTIHARIWAPPRLFYVNTRAAVAVDLGCAYTLTVNDQGAGLLKVTSGWVGFDRDGLDTYVPEGAVCPTRAKQGPGTPRYEDAPSGYAEALAVLDFEPETDPRRAAALGLVLSSARRRDAMTLWHLLTRGTPEERAQVYEKLAELVPHPPDITRDEILGGDRMALNRWWDALGVDATTWWRLFKKKW